MAGKEGDCNDEPEDQQPSWHRTPVPCEPVYAPQRCSSMFDGHWWSVILLFEIILTRYTQAEAAGMILHLPRQPASASSGSRPISGIIAFGLTLVMITGNIDLSVGSMLTFLCCLSAPRS